MCTGKLKFTTTDLQVTGGYDSGVGESEIQISAMSTDVGRKEVGAAGFPVTAELVRRLFPIVSNAEGPN